MDNRLMEWSVLLPIREVKNIFERAARSSGLWALGIGLYGL